MEEKHLEIVFAFPSLNWKQMNEYFRMLQKWNYEAICIFLVFVLILYNFHLIGGKIQTLIRSAKFGSF